ncbi:hypothetical protein ES703_56190 [subsurface metagenome]
MSNIEKLNGLLRIDEAGEELASLLNELLIDARKRNVLLVKLNEIRKEMSTLSLEIKLTRSEEMVRGIVLGGRKPLTAQEVAGRVGEQYRSLKHTTHASVVLNSLVSKGILGKFKLGYNYYFTSPREAVSEQLKRRDETPEECSPAEIAEETAMPLAVVLDAIEELLT